MTSNIGGQHLKGSKAGNIDEASIEAQQYGKTQIVLKASLFLCGVAFA